MSSETTTPTTNAEAGAAKKAKRSTLFWVRVVFETFCGEGFQELAIQYSDNQVKFLACVGLYTLLLTIAGKCGMDGLIGFPSGKPMALINMAYTAHLQPDIVQSHLADLIDAGMIHQDNNAYYITHWAEDGQPSSEQYNARTDEEKRQSHNTAAKKYRDKRKATVDEANAVMQAETPEEKAERTKTFDTFWRQYPDTEKSNRAEARKLWSLLCSKGIDPNTINYATNKLVTTPGSCLAPMGSKKKIPRAEDYLYRNLYNQVNEIS